MLDTPDLLNLFGLAFQVGGVGSGAYSVKEIIFQKMKIFQSTLDSTITLSDDQPTDNKTKKPVDKVIVIDHRKAIGGIIAIVAGLILQMVAIFF